VLESNQQQQTPADQTHAMHFAITHAIDDPSEATRAGLPEVPRFLAENADDRSTPESIQRLTMTLSKSQELVAIEQQLALLDAMHEIPSEEQVEMDPTPSLESTSQGTFSMTMEKVDDDDAAIPTPPSESFAVNYEYLLIERQVVPESIATHRIITEHILPKMLADLSKAKDELPLECNQLGTCCCCCCCCCWPIFQSGDALESSQGHSDPLSLNSVLTDQSIFQQPLSIENTQADALPPSNEHMEATTSDSSFGTILLFVCLFFSSSFPYFFLMFQIRFLVHLVSPWNQRIQTVLILLASRWKHQPRQTCRWVQFFSFFFLFFFVSIRLFRFVLFSIFTRLFICILTLQICFLVFNLVTPWKHHL
jgi:hypothetical protein